ncbi:MAG: hypothetical protein ACKVWR_05785 [Acidimicrobiales bacterium]
MNARRGLTCAAAALVIAAGCGSDEEQEAVAAATPAAANISLTASDFRFDGVPATVPAGPTAFTLTNRGQQPHHAQLLKFRPGKTIADLAAAQSDAAIAALATWEGGASVAAGPVATKATVKLEPGAYAVICVIPDSADGVSHAAKGMVAPLTVTGPPSNVELAKGDGLITMKDFTWDLSAVTKKGVYELRNDGPQPHELFVARLATGVTPEALVKSVTAPPAPGAPPPAGPPPFTPLGGGQAIESGKSQLVDLSGLAPGRYAAFCFIPDSANPGKIHAESGMLQEFDVKA